MYIVDHVPPGAVVKRRVEVSNSTASRRTISVYAAEAETRDGAFTFGAGRATNELTSWVTLDRPVLDLPAGGRALVAVTIRVPRSAAAGERYGVVWAETASPPAAGEGVTVVNRVGVRLYLSVGPGGEPPSDFRVESVAASRAADGQPVVVAGVRNTGGRALDLTGSLVLSDGPGGLSAGPFPALLGTTLALAEAKQVAVPLDKRLPDGPWRARLKLRSGFVKRVAEASLIFPPPAGDYSDAASQPWQHIAVLTAFVLLGLLLVWLTVHHSRKHRRRSASS
jgi:hypothetical protein